MPREDFPYAALGRELQRLMSRQHVNQTELSAGSDVSISYPSKVLSGERRPSLPVLMRMAEFLHADFDALARLAGFSAPLEADRPLIPGWDRLREVDKEQVRRTVALMAELNDAASASPEAAPNRPAAKAPASTRSAPQEPQPRPNRGGRATA